MPDATALLFDLVDVPPAGGCQAPIGRRSGRTRRRRHARHPAPTLTLLGELRALVAELAVDQQQRFRHLDRAMGRQARTLDELAEAFERICGRLVALERALGVCETPAMPRPTRHRPEA